MKERPILFSAPMVRAILEGRKTVTRRVVKPQPYIANVADDGMRYWNVSGAVGGRIRLEPDFLASCPYGQPGDRLWVRESFWKNEDGFKPTLLLGAKATQQVEYDASLNDLDREELRQFQYKRKPSIHMPRWASRITLEVTGMRVERLQDISEEDALAEGLHRIEIGSGYLDRYAATAASWQEAVEQQVTTYEDPRNAFRDLWESINGAGSWNANPWVWAVEFKRIQQAHAEVTAA